MEDNLKPPGWTQELFEALTAPFKPKYRPQGNAQIAYISAHQVLDRLLRVVGPAGWSTRYIPLHVDGQTAAVICELTILGETRQGVGSADRKDKNAEVNSHYKTAASTALKRAAREHGLGLHLWFPNQQLPPFSDRTAQPGSGSSQAPAQSGNGGSSQPAAAGGKPKQVTDEQLAKAVAKWEAKHAREATLQDKSAIRRWLATGQVPANGQAQPTAAAPQPVAAGNAPAPEPITDEQIF